MVESIKDLEKLLKLLRKQGVTKISLAECSLELGDLPIKHNLSDEEEETNQFEEFPDGPLTNEELTFFANGGNPQENPYRKN